MKTLKYILEASILGDIDDTLNKSDENAERYLIANWLNENKDLVSMFANRVSQFDASSNMRINNNKELDIYEFRPNNSYANGTKRVIDLPVPEYIKFNSVTTISLVGNNVDTINLKLMPHFNYCGLLFIRSWINDIYKPNLAQLDIDEIKTLYIDIENTRPASWPKSKISNVCLHTAPVSNYSIESLKNYNISFDINDLNGLHTNVLIIPDFFVTNSAIKFGYNGYGDREIMIDRSDAYEWESLNKIFATKTFKNLYVYDATQATIKIGYSIKKKGDSYIISKRGRNINNMIY